MKNSIASNTIPDLISKETYSKILYGKINEIDEEDGLLQEFLNEVRCKHIVPSVIVEYLCLCTDYTLALCVNQLLHC